MTALRRPGGRWRLLVHEYAGGGRYGDSYHVDSAGQPPPQARRWRAGSKQVAGTQHRTHELHLPHTELDEVVIGRWLHLEQMDATVWWLDVGGVVLLVTADRDGRPQHVTVYGPSDYSGPVDGCVYDLSWTHLPAGETTP